MEKEAKPDYLGHRQRLRHRFFKSGLSGFSEYEVLELLLTLAIPRRDVKPQAKALISRFGGLRRVLEASADEIRSIKGLGESASSFLAIVREVARAYLQQKAEQRSVSVDPESLADFWKARLGDLRNEVFEVGYLDSGYCLFKDGIERLQEGTIDQASVYPRRVMEAALKKGAAALVLAHNHPSGDALPSKQDRAITQAIIKAAEPLEIEVFDHFIVCSDKVFSFRIEGFVGEAGMPKIS